MPYMIFYWSNRDANKFSMQSIRFFVRISTNFSKMSYVEHIMSNALPIAVAILVGGVALAPVIYSVKNPTTPVSKEVKLGKDASNLQKISYALGYSLAQQVPPEADANALIAGFRDARDSKEAIYSNEEMRAAMEGYQKELAEQTTAEKSTNTVTVNPEVIEFFAENGKKAGVKTTPSGLQYKIIKEGKGASPSPTARVTVHYEGKLLNGSIFDSSLKRGEPITFALNQVIPGWTEGVGLMKEGGKAELYIPADLAYGEREMPGIPANSPLIFEVELIKIEE